MVRHWFLAPGIVGSSPTSPAMELLQTNAGATCSGFLFLSYIIGLMNIYISHASGYDYEKEIYGPIKASGLAKTHRFFLPHEPENIDVDAKDELKSTDVLVAEVSLPSTGQGIELGQANAAGVPVICFYRAGAKPSSSLRFVTDKVIEYNGSDDFIAKLQAELQA